MKTGNSIASVGSDALQPLQCRAAWVASEMQEATRWTCLLSPDEVSDLVAAVTAVKASNLDLVNLAQSDVPLPRLGPRLSRIREELVNGRGFVVIRGFPLDQFDRFEAIIAFLAIGLHFGIPVSQNAKGHLVGHVKDIGFDYRKNVNHRAYQTRLEITPHTDSCDIVGLLCLRPAKSGGLSTLASSVAIYNAMLARCPELAAELSCPVYFDRRGEVPEGKKPYYQIPIFNRNEHHLTTIYAPRYLYVVTRHAGVPELTERRKAAYAMLDTLASDDEFRLDMTFERGDIQLVFNHVILHSRTEYEDYEDPVLRRHLLRLWLSAADSRPLPKAFEERYGPIVPGNKRGGISVPGAKSTIPMEPE